MVRDQERRSVVGALPSYDLACTISCRRVEPERRFVEENQVRRLQEGSKHRASDPLTARQSRRARHQFVLQTETSRKGLDTLAARLDPESQCRPQSRREKGLDCDIREGKRVTRHPPDSKGVPVGAVRPGQSTAAASLVSRQNGEKSRLACTVVTDETNDRADRNVEIDTLQGCDPVPMGKMQTRGHERTLRSHRSLSGIGNRRTSIVRASTPTYEPSSSSRSNAINWTPSRYLSTIRPSRS